MVKKKSILTYLLVLTIFFCRAQSITTGIQGQFKSTWLINTKVLKANIEQEARPTFGWGGGLMACYFFKQQIDTYLGAGIELNFGNVAQRYSGRVSDTTQYRIYNSKINLLYLDVPVYAKLVLRFGTYIEAGMQFSLLAGANYRAKGGLEISKNVASNFSSFYYAPLIGIGGDYEISSDLYVSGGVRLVYGISDVKGVDGQGNDINTVIPGYPNYKGSRTHIAFAALNVGAYYRFDVGKYGRVGRHRRG